MLVSIGLLIGIAVVLGLAATISGRSSADDVVIRPFTSDGCSAWPDGTLKEKQLWLSCCTTHDRAYWQGGTYQQRLAADQTLRDCVAELGKPEIAVVMLGGVRVGGSPYWPTTFRWGYGWNWLRGYKAITEQERAVIEAMAQ